MEIKLEDHRILQLQATYSTEQIRGLAVGKRVDAFGQVAKLFQRPKPDEIEITALQKWYEPFWFAGGTARYAYERRHAYRIPVGPEVRSVTFLGKELSATGDGEPAIEVEGLDHCLEDHALEILLEAAHGEDAPELRRYLKYETSPIQNLAALQQDDAIVVPPNVLGSFVVRKLIMGLFKTIQADRVHEERIDVQEVTLYYRPVYAVEYFWRTKDRHQVLEFDALTGDVKTDATPIQKRAAQAIETDAVFDMGSGLQKLEIEIDHASAAQQVAEITESEVFRQLQERVKQFRRPGR